MKEYLGENYEIGSEWEVILYDVNLSQRQGYQLYVSRKQLNFLENYIYANIPTLKERIKILSIAREPGVLSKILYVSRNGEPIKWGAYKEQIMEVSKKLNGEIIEFIEYTNNHEELIRKAIKFDGLIKIDSFNKQATIITTKKGAIIGKNGVNVKLAGMLTGFKINVFTPEEQLNSLSLLNPPTN